MLSLIVSLSLFSLTLAQDQCDSLNQCTSGVCTDTTNGGYCVACTPTDVSACDSSGTSSISYVCGLDYNTQDPVCKIACDDAAADCPLDGRLYVCDLDSTTGNNVRVCYDVGCSDDSGCGVVSGRVRTCETTLSIPKCVDIGCYDDSGCGGSGDNREWKCENLECVDVTPECYTSDECPSTVCDNGSCVKCTSSDTTECGNIGGTSGSDGRAYECNTDGQYPYCQDVGCADTTGCSTYYPVCDDYGECRECDAITVGCANGVCSDAGGGDCVECSGSDLTGCPTDDGRLYQCASNSCEDTGCSDVSGCGAYQDGRVWACNSDTCEDTGCDSNLGKLGCGNIAICDSTSNLCVSCTDTDTSMCASINSIEGRLWVCNGGDCVDDGCENDYGCFDSTNGNTQKCVSGVCETPQCGGNTLCTDGVCTDIINGGTCVACMADDLSGCPTSDGRVYSCDSSYQCVDTGVCNADAGCDYKCNMDGSQAFCAACTVDDVSNCGAINNVYGKTWRCTSGQCTEIGCSANVGCTDQICNTGGACVDCTDGDVTLCGTDGDGKIYSCSSNQCVESGCDYDSGNTGCESSSAGLVCSSAGDCVVCDGDGDCEYGSCISNDCVTDCTENDVTGCGSTDDGRIWACDSYYTCYDDGCSDDSGCATGRVCVNGNCKECIQDDVTNCGTTDDGIIWKCGSYYQCYDGGCTTDTPCDTENGFTCQSNVCAPANPGCTSADECGVSGDGKTYLCYDFECKETGCSTTDGCTNTVCDNTAGGVSGRCEICSTDDVSLCGASGDGIYYKCPSNECVEDGCTDDTPCGDNRCNTDTKECVGCLTVSDCEARYDPLDVGYYICNDDGTCGTVECLTTAGDCTDAECIEGVCVDMCDNSCNADQSCQDDGSNQGVYVCVGCDNECTDDQTCTVDSGVYSCVDNCPNGCEDSTSCIADVEGIYSCVSNCLDDNGDDCADPTPVCTRTGDDGGTIGSWGCQDLCGGCTGEQECTEVNSEYKCTDPVVTPSPVTPAPVEETDDCEGKCDYDFEECTANRECIPSCEPGCEDDQECVYIANDNGVNEGAECTTTETPSPLTPAPTEGVVNSNNVKELVTCVSILFGFALLSIM